MTLSFTTVLEMIKNNPIPVPLTTDREFPMDIPMRDGYQSSLRIHKPSTSTTLPTPLVVLIYGGGFCLGHNSHLSPYSRAIAALYDVTVVNISYRIAPEFKFPTAPHDVWDSLKWLTRAENASALGLDPSAGFYIGGNSAGGNLAAVAAQLWTTEQARPPLSGVWLHIPLVLEEEIVPTEYKHLWFSREQNAKGMFLNREALDFIRKTYEQDVWSPDYSPFNVKDAHRGLPPVYFQVCGQDPLRDDGLIYERVLRENGVRTKIDVYPGVPHGYADFAPGFKKAEQYRLDTVKGFGWLLGKEVPNEVCQKELNIATTAQNVPA
jgi:acetyl esterase/lipase